MPPKTRERPGAETGATQSNSAGGLILAADSTSDASPETGVQLSRIETILDRIVGSLDRHAAISGA